MKENLSEGILRQNEILFSYGSVSFEHQRDFNFKRCLTLCDSIKAKIKNHMKSQKSKVST